MKVWIKIGVSALALVCSSAALVAQTQTLSCRPLAASSNFVYADEQVVGDQACKIVANPAAAQKQAVLTARVGPISDPQPAPAKVSVMSSAAVATQPENIPTESGMYVAADGSYTKILGQILDFTRSGSLLASDVTFHLKSSKENVQLLGPHAQTITASTPEFYFIPAKQEADAGVNAGDFILVHLEEKKERRQVEIGAEGVGRASKGIALTHQVQLSRSEVKPDVYKIAPAAGLSRGEYGLYLNRGEGMAAYIYDFSVQ
jgi:hypothetical protein